MDFKTFYDNPDIIIENLKMVYDQTTLQDYQEGKSWYESAHDYSSTLAYAYNIDDIKVAGIISAFSPMKSWDVNKQMVDVYLDTNGKIVKHTKTQCKKADAIYKGNGDKCSIEATLNGLKTVNFFNNIYNPNDDGYVTIDRHHIYVCTGMDLQVCTNKQYEFIKKITIMFSKITNLRPCQLQATLWVAWKRLKKETNAKIIEDKEQWDNDRIYVLGNDKISLKEQEQVVEAYLPV